MKFYCTNCNHTHNLSNDLYQKDYANSGTVTHVEFNVGFYYTACLMCGTVHITEVEKNLFSHKLTSITQQRNIAALVDDLSKISNSTLSESFSMLMFPQEISWSLYEKGYLKGMLIDEDPSISYYDLPQSADELYLLAEYLDKLEQSSQPETRQEIIDHYQKALKDGYVARACNLFGMEYQKYCVKVNCDPSKGTALQSFVEFSLLLGEQDAAFLSVNTVMYVLANQHFSKEQILEYLYRQTIIGFNNFKKEKITLDSIIDYLRWLKSLGEIQIPPEQLQFFVDELHPEKHQALCAEFVETYISFCDSFNHRGYFTGTSMEHFMNFGLSSTELRNLSKVATLVGTGLRNNIIDPTTIIRKLTTVVQEKKP